MHIHVVIAGLEVGKLLVRDVGAAIHDAVGRGIHAINRVRVRAKFKNALIRRVNLQLDFRA